MTSKIISSEYACDDCLDGDALCPGGYHPFGPCGDPTTCETCGRQAGSHIVRRH